MNILATAALRDDLAALTLHHAQCRSLLEGWQGRWHRLAASCERAHSSVAPRFFTTVAVAGSAMVLLLTAFGR